MKVFLKKLAYATSSEFTQKNWMNLTLFAASIAFLILMWMYNWVETKVTISLLVLVFNFLAFRFIKFENDMRADIGVLRSDLTGEQGHRVESTDAQGFYHRMIAAVTSAVNRADVTRLDQTKPSESSVQEAKDYYETATDVVKKGRITFRRLVKVASPSVLEWVLELIEELGECPNFALASLRDTDRTALSIQIFDTKELLFVQPDAGIVGSGPYRFMLRITGNTLAQAFSDYYDRVWQDSIRIKDGNTIHWNNLSEMGQRVLRQAEDQKDEFAIARVGRSLRKLKKMAAAAEGGHRNSGQRRRNGS